MSNCFYFCKYLFIFTKEFHKINCQKKKCLTAFKFFYNPHYYYSNKATN